MNSGATIMEAAVGGRQAGNLGAAERLMELSIDHGIGMAGVLAKLARDLADLEARHRRELACAEERERLRLRAEHAGRVAARYMEAAARLAEFGSAMRSGFSRLLTEQLASGNQGLMDDFQEFFAVLPEQDVDLQGLLDVAIGRLDAALGEMTVLLAAADVQPTPVTPARRPRRAARVPVPPAARAAAAG